jgi:hypothetical protein
MLVAFSFKLVDLYVMNCSFITGLPMAVNRLFLLEAICYTDDIATANQNHFVLL